MVSNDKFVVLALLQAGAGRVVGAMEVAHDPARLKDAIMLLHRKLDGGSASSRSDGGGGAVSGESDAIAAVKAEADR